jgi:hypothetical protein
MLESEGQTWTPIKALPSQQQVYHHLHRQPPLKLTINRKDIY